MKKAKKAAKRILAVISAAALFAGSIPVSAFAGDISDPVAAESAVESTGSESESAVTLTPTPEPTAVPTAVATAVPTKAPTAAPTKAPTAAPTKTPTAVPTKSPARAAAPRKAPAADETPTPRTPNPTVSLTKPNAATEDPADVVDVAGGTKIYAEEAVTVKLTAASASAEDAADANVDDARYKFAWYREEAVQQQDGTSKNEYVAIANETSKTYTPDIAGNYRVTVSSDEDAADSRSAFSKDYDFTVEKMPLRVTWTPFTKIYDGTTSVSYTGTNTAVALNGAENETWKKTVTLSNDSWSGTLTVARADIGNYSIDAAPVPELTAEENKKYSVSGYDVKPITGVVNPAPLDFTITVKDKNFDNTTGVESDPVVTASVAAGSALDGKTVTIVTGSDNHQLTKEDIAYESAGNVAADTAVNLVLPGDLKVYVSDADTGAVDENYSVNVTGATGMIKAVKVSAEDCAAADSSLFQDGSTYWLKKNSEGDTTTTLTAKEGYTLAAALDGSFDETATVTITADGGKVYAKNADGDIAEVTVSDIKTDGSAPTVTLSKDTDQTFGNGALELQAAIEDTDSGVNTGKLYSIVTASADEPEPDADFTGWTALFATPEKDGTYTAAVRVPSAGYLWIYAEDNVGNRNIAKQHMVILEDNKPDKPTIVPDSADPAREHEVTIKTSDAAAEAAQSGIQSVHFQILDSDGQDVTDQFKITASIGDGLSFGNNTVTRDAAPDTLEEAAAAGTLDAALTIAAADGKTPDGEYDLYVTAADYCGNTETETAGLDFDTVLPTASVMMSGEKFKDDRYYYRADNSALTVILSDRNLSADGWNVSFTKDGAACTAPSYTTVTEEGTGITRVSFSAEDVAALGDGLITVTVTAKDAAGNELAELAGSSQGVTRLGKTASFVLDTTAPAIIRAVTSAEGQKYDSTVDYNQDVTSTVTISDANIDSSCWTCMPEARIPDDGSTVTFALANGTSVVPEISGADFAGNKLIVSDTVDADDQNQWTASDGTAKAVLRKIVNTKTPSVMIAYSAENGGEERRQLDAAYLVGKNAYYKDEIVKITLTFSGLRDADESNDLDAIRVAFAKNEETPSAEEAKTLKEIGAEKDGENYVYTFVLGSNKDDEDQSINVKLYGANRAGTPLTVQEANPATGEAEDSGTTEEDFSGTYTVVWDRTAPKAHLSIHPSDTVKNKDLADYNGKRAYYFNGAYTVKADVVDANLSDSDPTVFVKRIGKTADGDASETEFTAADDAAATALTGKFDAEDHVLRFDEDTESAESVYRYYVYGTDLAGNEVEVTEFNENSGDTLETGGGTAYLSWPVVLDTTAPTATLTITDSSAIPMWTQTTGNAASFKNIYSQADSAKISLALDNTEVSPVIYSYSRNGKNGTEVSAEENTSYIYYAAGAAFGTSEEKAEQIFTVSDLTVTDLAGNASGTFEATGKLYLDQTAPKSDDDKLAPNVAVATSNTVAVRDYGNEGQPLFGTGDGDITFDVRITDPYGESTTEEAARSSSGLKGITWTLYSFTGSGSSEELTPVSGYENIALDLAAEGALAAPDRYAKEGAISVSREVNLNNLKLVVTATDNSGNKADADFYFGIDNVAPSVTVTFDNNDAKTGKYFNAARTATIAVTERNFDPDRTVVVITKDGTEAAGTDAGAETGWRTVKGSAANGDSDVHTKSITFSNDGYYTFHVFSADGGADTAEDEAGNIAKVTCEETAPNDFVIDTLAPEVSIKMGREADSEDGHYYYRADNGDIAVRITDHGRDMGMVSDTAVYRVTIDDAAEKAYVPDGTASSGAAFSYTANEIASNFADGTHVIAVTATDAAGNTATELMNTGDDRSVGCEFAGMTGTFILDKTNPVLTAITTTPSDAAVTDNRVYSDTNSVYYNKEISVVLTVEDAYATSRDFSGSINRDGESGTAPRIVNTASGVTYAYSMGGSHKYDGLTVSGADKAGNRLVLSANYSHNAVSSVDNLRDLGDGSIAALCGKVVDLTAPTVTITYSSDSTANLYSGETAGKTSAYYNQDVTVGISFNDNYELDSAKLSAGAESAAAHPADAGLADTVTVPDISIHAEGRYSYTAFGTDRALNPVTVREQVPFTVSTAGGDAGYRNTDGAADGYASLYEVVLDKTAPTFTIAITSNGASRPDRNSIGNRYYFNQNGQTGINITEENFDASKIHVMRGSVSQGNFDSSARIISSFGETVSVRGKQVTDTVTENGVYRYAVYGCDKAGNALVPEAADAAALDGTAASLSQTEKTALTRAAFGTHEETENLSAHIVIDKVAPVGSLEISNGSTVYYRMGSNGSVSLSEPYREEHNARVRFLIDTNIEHTPSMITYAVSANPSSNSVGETSGSYAYGNTAEVSMNGRMQFRVSLFRITDLAGNVTSVASPNLIYLDMERPNVDRVAPTVSVVANARSDARDGNGQPLFRSDVPVSVVVSDPYAGSGSSGVGNVTFEVYVNGALRETRTLHQDYTKRWTNSYQTPDLEYTVSRTENISSGTYNYNNIRIRVTVRDNAGNTNFAETTFGIDVTRPRIAVSYDNNSAQNGKYFKENRVATVVVTERNFDASRININTQSAAGRSGWSHTRGASANGDDDTWTARITYATDGNYTLSISGADLLGNQAEATVYNGTAPTDFVLDKTKPVVNVTYDNNDVQNGKYYKAARTARVSVTDTNFSGENNISVKASEGGSAPSVRFSGRDCSLPFGTDGVYSFSGTVTDLAGNVSDPINESEFVIDTVKPEISIEGVDDLSANRVPLSIILTMKDKNLSQAGIHAVLRGTNGGEVDISGKRENIDGGVRYVLDPINTDDYYTLVFTGTDLAGNADEMQVSFSENQGGVKFAFNQKDIDGGYTNKAFTPAFTLDDIDEITITSVMVNGQEVAYTFRNNVLRLKDEIDKDGKYTITIDARDAAGNQSSMTPVEFYLDQTAPVVTVTGLTNGQYYYYDPMDVTIRFDNLDDSIMNIILNDKTLGPDDYTVNEDGSVTLHISDFTAYHLVASVKDEAGNTGSVEARFALTRNPFIRWFNNRPVFVISLAAIAGFIVWLIFFLRRRKNKDEEEGAA